MSQPSYKLINPDKPAQVAIKCKKCGFISYNKYDVLYKYCGKCHIFHEDQEGGAVMTTSEH